MNERALRRLHALVRLMGAMGIFACVIGALSIAGCSTTTSPEATSAANSATRAPDDLGHTDACPARAPAEALLPSVKAEHTTLAYWLARYSQAELDEELLSADEITRYGQAVGRRPGHLPFAQRDLRVPVDPLALAGAVRERLRALAPEVERGKLRDVSGQPLPAAAAASFRAALPSLDPKHHVLLSKTILRCGPWNGPLYKEGDERAYDRNACGALHAQELVELLARDGSGMWLARSRFALGYLPGDIALSPALSAAQVETYVRGARVHAPNDIAFAHPDGTRVTWPAYTSLPLTNRNEVLVASEKGIASARKPPDFIDSHRPLTRRALLTAAFGLLGAPYGLGGAELGRDCSGLLLDLFDAFDLPLPRHSGWQAQAGVYSVSLAGKSEAQKLDALTRAGKSGAVLLHFPGHIMLYLGQSAEGAPMVLHALGDYAQACPGGGETVRSVQRTVVSTLELGRGSSRTSLVERLTRLVVFGRMPAESAARGSEPQLHMFPPALPPASADACRDQSNTRIFTSPAVPLAGKPLRVIATSTTPISPAWLALYDEHGELLSYDGFTLGGPPYTHVARIVPRANADTKAGTRITAVLGQGDQRLACKQIRVRDAALAKEAPAVDAQLPFWQPRFRWEADTENFYSAFVEQLFTGAPDDEETWTNLHTLLRDPSRNLLHDHLGLGEDDALTLQPDCADLPYTLRAYFAWKLRLPYAFRRCSRGRAKQAPTCGEPQTMLLPRTQPDEVAGFGDFARRFVGAGVHSATGRTLPDDPATDLYPVALERAALAPGTVFADPYGHLLVVSKWFPQGSVAGSRYGVLIGAEAQPDGTIGRRRFWEGSFLFDPSTESVGAGFKRFRPLEYDRATQTLRALDNTDLSSSRVFARFSRAQYEGSRESFYARMDALINPEPLEIDERMRSLIDALDEASRRRVLAVDNGEAYFAQRPSAVIAMPHGYAVFETVGPWEDFATPSRDMRLLIAIDTVLALPERIAKEPERFRLPAGQTPQAAAQATRETLMRELRARTFTYTQSHGGPRTLSLADVVARKAELEIGYNPNDCPEIRWGESEGSPERQHCKRMANAEQRARMLAYREWFRTRTRPNRGD